MNRLLFSATRQQLSRRPLISSLETGGHAHAKTGYSFFSQHPSWYRYLGAIILLQAPLPLLVFWNDNNYDERKLESSILSTFFSDEFILRDLNLTVCSYLYAAVCWFVGRTLLF